VGLSDGVERAIKEGFQSTIFHAAELEQWRS
jgi:hypothetical protein